ncbi:carboxypeptidase-like regulatory domain-containing protein [Flavobacterium lindanitolerans]|uniref:Carboxypeptidase-like protein n=1 Tax=Flavobacterium lindanitolerans TaxID=428988 RepID=A0A497UGH1_9FLAO|nr:carboxypeptidase-like regulatory domain-containing protein [Flavobacterium lindanitolerans]PKW20320.1 carboxypeptidase-like protein [Flavobacterium lindanitolerans]RLJ23723.1 carboxypeptidase-like protein [Flavobacterium lindanitolerans]
MNFFKNLFTIIVLLISFQGAYSQVLEGHVYDMQNNALQAATVYLDGSTVATTTDAEGYFRINGNANSRATLIVSYMGYKTIRLENPFQHKKIKVLMEEDAITMPEVVLQKGPFTRKEMMKAFKEQFLGNTDAGSSCKILNEDDINLYYDIATNTLNATSHKPIKIKNSYLGYEVFFELADFNVVYRRRSLSSFSIDKSYFSGTTFYKVLSESKKTDKRRLASYLGSTSHFVNTIANESWDKEKLALFVDGFKVDPKKYFEVSDTLGFKKITVLKEPMQQVPIYKKEFPETARKGKTITIGSKPEITGYNEVEVPFNVLFDNKHQSLADFTEKVIFVDENGNYSPVYGVMVGGYMSSLKVGDMLPTDYYQSVKGKY